jgi:Family of unknown function (DUF5519)/Metallo-beta-lactamase superfamily
MATIEQKTASERITDEVTSWPGVEAGMGRRGEFGFTVGRKQIGHLHGDRAAHFSFPKQVWRELYEQGRIDYHPVFPGKQGPASRLIDSEDDVRDVIELLRLNYDRAVRRKGLRGLTPLAPERLPFAPSLEIRAFLLEREQGDVLIYSTGSLDGVSAERWYLNHGHEAMFAADGISAPLFVHESDRDSVEPRHHVRGAFSRRHMIDDDFEVIPTPGHTPGATAYLWDSGEHRFLFTGDTIYLDDGEWAAAVLDSSDPEAYVESLKLIRELDFDVLVPWAATAGQDWYSLTTPAETRRRIDAMVERIAR